MRRSTKRWEQRFFDTGPGWLLVSLLMLLLVLGPATLADSGETMDLIGSPILWKDDTDTARPEQLVLILLADGREVDRIYVSKDGWYRTNDPPEAAEQPGDDAEAWSWAFTGLPVRGAAGEISYTVGVEDPPGYTAAVTGSAAEGFGIILSRSGRIDITGTKVWKDSGNQDGIRPDSIVIHLWADGSAEEIAQATVSAPDWTWQFPDLPGYDSEGQPIVYTITEDAVNGYQSEVSGE